MVRNWTIRNSFLQNKYSISIRGHSTSYSLEPEFYDELKKIAAGKKMPLATLITQLDEKRSPVRNLSPTLRVYVLDELLKRKTN
jgi:predicted DNA-binding ribbon-helix-helix protein